jgi:hypothetical protein
LLKKAVNGRLKRLLLSGCTFRAAPLNHRLSW